MILSLYACCLLSLHVLGLLVLGVPTPTGQNKHASHSNDHQNLNQVENAAGTSHHQDQWGDASHSNFVDHTSHFALNMPYSTQAHQAEQVSYSGAHYHPEQAYQLDNYDSLPYNPPSPNELADLLTDDPDPSMYTLDSRHYEPFRYATSIGSEVGQSSNEHRQRQSSVVHHSRSPLSSTQSEPQMSSNYVSKYLRNAEPNENKTDYWNSLSKEDKSKLNVILSGRIAGYAPNSIGKEAGQLMMEEHASLQESKDENKIQEAIEMMDSLRTGPVYHRWVYTPPRNVPTTVNINGEDVLVTWSGKLLPQRIQAVRIMKKWSTMSGDTLKRRALKGMTDKLFDMVLCGNEGEEMKALKDLNIRIDKLPPWMQGLQEDQIESLVSRIVAISGMRPLEIYFILRSRNATKAQGLAMFEAEDDQIVWSILMQLLNAQR